MLKIVDQESRRGEMEMMIGQIRKGARRGAENSRRRKYVIKSIILK